MLPPNHSSGKERDSLPAEFPVPKCSPGTVGAVIHIPQFPSVGEQSSAVLNTSLSLPSLPAALPATCCHLQRYAYCVPVIPVSHVQQLKSSDGPGPLPIDSSCCSLMGLGEKTCTYTHIHTADSYILNLTCTLQIQPGSWKPRKTVFGGGKGFFSLVPPIYTNQ